MFWQGHFQGQLRPTNPRTTRTSGLRTKKKWSRKPEMMQSTAKKCWVVWPQIWVKYGQTQMLG